MYRLVRPTKPAQNSSEFILEIETINSVTVNHGKEQASSRFQDADHFTISILHVCAMKITQNLYGQDEVKSLIWKWEICNHSIEDRSLRIVRLRNGAHVRS